jgi:hypothetical protein
MLVGYNTTDDAVHPPPPPMIDQSLANSKYTPGSHKITANVLLGASFGPRACQA